MYNFQNQKRTTESPMDFEWQTHAPTDPNSPFPQYRPQDGQKKSFESPAKSSFASQSAAQAPPFRNPSFTTPRKPFDQELFSEFSGAESSPADNTDADIEDTPEPKSITKAMTAVGISNNKAPLFGRYGNSFMGNSPSRLDQRRGKYGNAILNKARKRKRIDRDHALITRTGSDSESEGEDRPKEKNTRGGRKTSGWFVSIIDGIEKRPNLPNILSYYAQLLLNFGIVFAIIYLAYCFWGGVREDVDKASDEARFEVMAKMAACANHYTINKCADQNRPPALDTVCNEWDLCMNKDPGGTGRAKLSARTFAEIFNSFVEPISWKAMIFVLLIITVSIAVNNLAFGMFRSKSHPHIPMPQVPQYFTHQPQWGQGHLEGVPQTPQHQNGYDAYGGAPFHQIMPSQTPMRSPSKEMRSPSKGQRSPSKGSRVASKGDRDLVMYDS